MGDGDWISEPGRPQSDHAARVLVLDTDPGVRWALEKGLAKSGYLVRAVGIPELAIEIVESEDVSAVVMEILPDAGLDYDVLAHLVRSPDAPKVVCSSIESNPQQVIECMRRGASDFLVRPFSLAEIRDALSRALSEASQRNSAHAFGAAVELDESGASLIVGVSEPIRELRSLVKLVSQTNLNCLIRGESGVGKDVVAREIHRVSARCEFPFIKVNCSALPEQLLESELFGFEKGAFTGAVSSKPGRFSLADKGIIFLDEIGEMHPNVQAKLLQVIEHKEFTKLGGRDAIKVDVQIIAATNADLEKNTKNGLFRQDLFFRLNEVCIWVPPLEARREDVPLLIRHFIQKYRHFAKDGMIDRATEAIQALSDRPWPGNVRELESSIKRWLVLGDKGLGIRYGEDDKRRTAQRGQYAQTEEKNDREFTPEEILQALEANHWNRRKTADALGISYQVLRRRIDKFRLEQRR